MTNEQDKATLETCVCFIKFQYWKEFRKNPKFVASYFNLKVTTEKH